jgi:hypothetical protein
MVALRDELRGLGYGAVPGAEHYQFRREVLYRGAQRELKVDFLAPPPRAPHLLAKVQFDARRIRNRMAKGIHAHTTPEAFSIAERVLAFKLGDAEATHVHVPHPYTFLLLKLFAFRDLSHDAGKEFGRYHAFDLYRIIAMMNEQEYEDAERFRDRFEGEDIVKSARRIVAELFTDRDSRGPLAILEHARTVGANITNDDLVGFLEDLETFFPRPS